MTSSTLRQLRRHVLIYAGLAPFVVIAVSPVYWMAITAFKLQIEEAAWVDGCTRAGGIWHVLLPVSRPGMVITAILAFSLIRGDIYYWGSLMAGALIVGVPIALLYTFVLDHFIEGLTGVGVVS